jgi:N-acetylglucosamine-6-phosphate deacetylase
MVQAVSPHPSAAANAVRIRARHYATGERIELLCDRGQIVSRTAATTLPAHLEAGWVVPAFFDLQINGCDGQSFNSDRLTVDMVRRVAAVCRRHGIGQFCPTLVTNAYTSLAHGFATLRKACETDAELALIIPGFHLEGPYISAEDGPRGAHPRAHVRPPDWQEFCRLQEAAGDQIRLVTLAPELENALEFIEQLVRSGVVVALGHTAASAGRIRDAIAAGATLSTHLGNGSHALLPRHDNYIWEQLAADELWASIICDGHHLPPSVVRCMVRVKTPARTILTCDASSLAGLPPGKYREWNQDFEVLSEGKIVVCGTSYLAGSGAFTDRCISNVIRFAGVGLQEAIEMAGNNPRALLGLPLRALEPGCPADLVLFDWEPGGDIHVKALLP